MPYADRTRPLLFEELPRLAGALPWLPLADAPTPVERCTALAEWLGRDDVWMKRDDLVSSLYGGNKVRRYEFVLGDALDRGAKRLVTAGGLASTQVTATVALGRSLGFAVRAVLYDQPVTSYLREALLADVSLGAELIYGGGYVSTAWRTWQEWRRDRPENYFLMPGASHPLANLGYVDMMLELALQVDAGDVPRPDVIVVPTGSSGTLVALALGAAYLGWPTEIVGVRIAPRIVTNRFTIAAVLHRTRRLLVDRAGVPRSRLRSVRWRLFHGAYGRGYGWPTPEAIDGVERWLDLTGVPGEVTYSGKALVGLRAIARDPRYQYKKLLLLNTLSRVRPTIARDAMERLPEPFHKLFRSPVRV